jgi:hypothetical protein
MIYVLEFLLTAEDGSGLKHVVETVKHRAKSCSLAEGYAVAEIKNVTFAGKRADSFRIKDQAGSLIKEFSLVQV